ncbi:hypothetical protein F0562_024832 [Nyssa sinensis]|uniref:Uncharacterized protein n=1 Tax=Nyssa sinensis TaxID=561372 RepID=A0A5J5BIU3_9ASTE|nr:hypothetical protein F0562_024832 [Nyssa sinensis]
MGRWRWGIKQGKRYESWEVDIVVEESKGEEVAGLDMLKDSQYGLDMGSEDLAVGCEGELDSIVPETVSTEER